MGSQGSQLPPLFHGDGIYWPRQLTESDITDLNSHEWDKKRSAHNKIIEKCEHMSRNENYEALSKIQHELVFAKYHHHCATRLKQLLDNRHYDELLSLLKLISALQLHTNSRHYNELMQSHWLLASMHMAEANQEILIEIATSTFPSEDVRLQAIITFSQLATSNWKMQLKAMKKGLFDVLFKLLRSSDHNYVEKIILALVNLVDSNFRLQKWLHENLPDLFPKVWEKLGSGPDKDRFEVNIEKFENQLLQPHTRDYGDGPDEFTGDTITLRRRTQVGGTCYAYASARSFIHR